MGSKYTEAFDSLKSDDKIRQERTERILAAQNADHDIQQEGNGAASAVKVRGKFFAGRRGIALLTAIVLLVTFAAFSITMVIRSVGSPDILRLLKDTYVDMEGITAFGLWNAPDSAEESGHISSVSYVHTTAYSEDDEAEADGESEDGAEESDVPDENGTASGDTSDDDIISGDWSDDDRYDWESDYDWDPTKANVLISIGEDGKVSEVIYERTNGRGQVRQDSLGNVAAVYVSKSYTYVKYVNDDRWQFWTDMSFMNEALQPCSFSCHHEKEQTIVIHNETGKVFALNDLISQVSDLSGDLNHTMQVQPFRDDYLYLRPMYGNYIPQWYNVVYDEAQDKLRYELMIPEEVFRTYSLTYNVDAVRRDIYGQTYLLEGYWDEALDVNEFPRVTEGIVEVPEYTVYDDTLIFNEVNGLMYGSDGRIYAFDDGKLKVFGEDFTLHTVEPGTQVTMEGIAGELGGRTTFVNDGVVYRLQDGYVFSMFGEVWQLDDEGTMHARSRLEGSFPAYGEDGYMLGGEIIAFVDAEQYSSGAASVNGRFVRIRFDTTGDTPKLVEDHIIYASEFHMVSGRLLFEQNENPLSLNRGDTKYFLMLVQNGEPVADYYGYGYGGRMLGVTKPITEPVLIDY